MTGICPHDSRSDNYNFCRRHTGDPAEKDPGSAVFSLKAPGTYLDGQPSRNLTHGGQQGEVSVSQLDGLVGNADDLFLKHRLCKLLVCGQVEVSKDALALSHESVLLFQRFLDLENEIRIRPHLFAAIRDFSPGLLVLDIRHVAPYAGSCFHQNGMSVKHEGIHPFGCHGHAFFFYFDLFGNADDHVSTPFPYRVTRNM